MLTWNQGHTRGRLIQDELKIYRRSYHPPNLNFSVIFSLLLFSVSFLLDARAFKLNARALAYYDIIILIMRMNDHVISLMKLAINVKPCACEAITPDGPNLKDK